MISVSQWIEIMKMLSDPNSVINSHDFREVRSDVERLAIELHPGGRGDLAPERIDAHG